MTCLGAGFEYSNWENRGGLDFQLETQAREVVANNDAYLCKVTRLEWASYLNTEDDKVVKMDFLPGASCPLASLGYFQRKALRDQKAEVIVKKYETSCVGPNNVLSIKNANEPAESIRTEFGNYQDTVIIPAAVPSDPSKETRDVKFPKSFLGGRQLCLSKNSTVEYTLPPDMVTSTTIEYQLSLKVCTVHRNEDPLQLIVSADGIDPVEYSVDLPYTVGMWDLSKPIPVKIGGPGVGTTKLTLKRTRTDYAISIKQIEMVRDSQVGK